MSRSRRVLPFVVAAGIVGLACTDTVAPGFQEVGGTPCTAVDPSVTYPVLPVRAPPAGIATTAIPHQQLNAVAVPEVIADMTARIFALTDVESRPSVIVDNATAIWLRPEFNLGRPECVIRARELGHIHLDGTVHLSIPLARIQEATTAGWVAQHPWAFTNPGFEAYVLAFSPRETAEADVIVDLVAEGVEYVRGN